VQVRNQANDVSVVPLSTLIVRDGGVTQTDTGEATLSGLALLSEVPVASDADPQSVGTRNDPGVSPDLSRDDHTHDGSTVAASAIATHVGLADPHTQYALESALGTLATQNGTFSGTHSGTSTGTNTGDQTISDATISTTDITTNNVTSTKHGFAPKAPADATQFLNGAATPAFAAVKDSDLATTDITTNNASTTKHGFAPKLPNDATKFYNGVATSRCLRAAWTCSPCRYSANHIRSYLHGDIYEGQVIGAHRRSRRQGGSYRLAWHYHPHSGRYGAR
jgi:hypothetical protein